MSQRRAREAAMQAIFSLDINDAGGDIESALSFAWSEGGDEGARGDESFDYARLIFTGTVGAVGSIDESISGVSHKWRLSRMNGIDRSILRLAVYEMRFVPDLTPGIVINEAVELAKKFGTDKSPRFVNGILSDLIEYKPG